MERIWIAETTSKVDQRVMIKGWIHVRRDMGKVVFLDVRDRSGLVQVVASPKDLDPASAQVLTSLRPEYVVEIEGEVHARPPKQVNDRLPTGGIELLAKRLTLINSSKTPPFELTTDGRDVNEELRLEFRYLDLRRERMRGNLENRHRIIKTFRDQLTERGFWEIETPNLTKATPEGARDFLVPVRQKPGYAFALPQSPQQYKQLLMIAGVERYFQVARCFRDEDQRGARQPEFTQLDVEMSFVTQEDLLKMMEEVITSLVKTLYPQAKMQTPWPRLSYRDVIKQYGTDKPDLRDDPKNPNELAFAWILEWPMFEWNKDENRWDPCHHIFTAPHADDREKLKTDPGGVRSLQHDLVLNGYEAAGGSIRIHESDLQRKVFELVGLKPEESERKFSHLLRAFEYGAPPHGGIAIGLDRFIMCLQNEPDIREVMPFPKTGDARDPLMGAPSLIEEEQLKELHLSINKKEEL